MSLEVWHHMGPSGEPQCSSEHGICESSKEALVNSVDPLQSCPEIKIEIDDELDTSLRPNQRHSRYLDSLAHLCEVAVDWHSCGKCGMKFPLENMLNRHKAHHFDIRKRKIKKFDESVEPRKDKSKRVSRKMTCRSSYSCTLCDFVCEKRTDLSSHLRRKHDAKSVADNNVECEARNSISVQDSLGKVEEQNETFTCNICNFECKKRSTLASHVNRKHRKKVKMHVESVKLEVDDFNLEEYQCEKCDYNTDTEAGLRIHAKNHEGMEKTTLVTESFECTVCEFVCANKRTLYSHKRRHRVENIDEIYSCNECNFKTEKKTSLYSHIKRKHRAPKPSTGSSPPELFSCSQCDYKNKNKYELKIHVARKHTDDFKFSCETCNKKFKVKGDLTNHVRFSHREQPVICDVCGKTCLNSNSLYVHQKFAHYKAKYECQVCKRRMVSQENLDEHMLRQHEKRENVVCEECGKTFSRNTRLKIHMRIHTGDKPYDCTICNKSFGRRTALKQHLLIHTGVKPYVCDICGKAFTQKPGLISHRKSHPGPHPPLPRVRIDHILNDVLRPAL